MRFCPFCSAENADELAVCGACGRRLPPLPPRRARGGPATGVQLPPRAATTTQPPQRPATTTQPPRGAGPTNPPPLAGAPSDAPGPTAASLPTPPRRAGSTNPPPLAGLPIAPPHGAGPAVSQPRVSEPLPPGQQGVLVTSVGVIPVAASPAAGLRAPAPPPAPAPALDEGARALANALSPGPAAQRREPSPAEPVGPDGRARRVSDLPAGLAAPPPAAAAPPRAMPSVLGSGPRAAPASAPPVAPERAMLDGPRATPDDPRAAPAAAGVPNPHAAPDPPWATGYPRAPAGFGAADPSPAPPLEVDATRARGATDDPPPTRIHRPEALVDRPFTPPSVNPVPGIPEPGLINSARYAVRFARARVQRGGAIKVLGVDIKKDTDALDQVLGALGGVARTAKVDSRVFSGENAAITAAEQRAAQMSREHNELDARKLEENSKFIEVERERNAKLAEAERMVDEAQKEIAQLETQRKSLRDKRKELERRQKAYLKAAEDNDRQTGNAELGDTRQELRRAAEQHRREAAALEPERQEIDRRLGALERPLGEVTAKLDAAKAELDAAKRSLADAREGHTHRLAELDAEQKRKAREIAQAEGEIARRLVTLGTLVNLNRVEDPQFAELYDRIDRLRGAINARTTEIERLTAEREAYDRGNLVRGVATIGGAILLVIALIVILRALLAR